MKLIGDFKKQVEKAQTKEEARDVIKTEIYKEWF